MLDAVTKAGVFHKSVNMIQSFHLLSDVSLHHRQGLLRLSQCYSRLALKHTSAQANLPRQPVPALNDTLRKFVRSAKPFVTPAELNATESHIASFESKDGPALQKLLEERAKKMDNWLADWWLVAAYLGYRLPVVIHSSPGLIFPHQQFHTQDDFLKYAAHLTVAALHGKELIHSGRYPVDMAGKEALDMTQYTRVFGTCRIPAPEVDKMWYMDQQNPARYIAVAHKNHFFKVDVYDKQGQLLDGNTIVAQFKRILKETAEPADPVGILTSEHRDAWAKIYPDLINDPQNKASVETIQKALFLVCLDEPSRHLTAPSFATEAALRIVHGGGSKASSGNRWFDKTIQVVVSSDGANGITCEHSPAEAVPMASLMDFCLNFMKNNKLETSAAPQDFPKPEKLSFTLSPGLKSAIQEAENNLDKLVDDTEFISCTFPGYGKNFAKSQRVSPDSYIQMAIQLAFYRLHNKPGAHYESAATRKYYLGRTETIRSCSLESVKFAQTMLDPKASAAEKKQALLDAINYHKEYAIMAANGHGVDRHLLGLKLTAAENGMKIHPLYQDPAYTRSNHFRVTTSQVAGRCDAVMCYGPVVPDGYACCYNPLPDSINFGLAAFKSCPETSVKSFQDALMTSLEEMKQVMETGGVWRNEVILQEKNTGLHKQDIAQK